MLGKGRSPRAYVLTWRYADWMRDDDNHRLLGSHRGHIDLFGRTIAHGRLHLVLPTLLCLLLPVTALAQDGQDVRPATAPKAVSRLDLEQRFLRVESSIWAPFGLLPAGQFPNSACVRSKCVGDNAPSLRYCPDAGI